MTQEVLRVLAGFSPLGDKYRKMFGNSYVPQFIFLGLIRVAWTHSSQAWTHSMPPNALDDGPRLPIPGFCRDGERPAGYFRTTSGDFYGSSLEKFLPTHRAQPYQWAPDMVEDNGGTVVAVAGPDYCIVAADTRLSSDYRIRTRNVSRLIEISPCTFVGMAGSWADVTTLRHEVKGQ
jgi:hypothetical protein